MATSTKPRSIILVPGAWHKAAVYDILIAQLKQDGYAGRLIPIELATVDAAPDSPAMWSMLPDIQGVEDAIASEVENGTPVLVLAHSYGAVPASCALKKFASSGLVKFVILAGFILELGESIIALGGGKPPPLWQQEGDYVWPNPAFQDFYSDLPEATQKELSSKLKSHTYTSKISPATFEGWAAVPTTYIACLQDKAIIYPWQEQMINRAKAAGAKIDVETIDASHSPMISQPQKLAEILMKLAA